MTKEASMKKYLLLFLLIPTLCFADVIGVIRKISFNEETGAINVCVQEYYDGKLITTGKPGDYDVFSLFYDDLKDKTPKQVNDLINSAIQKRLEEIILNQYTKTAQNPAEKAYFELTEEKASQLSSVFNDLIDTQIVANQVSIPIDTDGDKINDDEVTINSNLTTIHK
jgi:hypothetical protein